MAAPAGKTNWFAIWVSVGVVVALALVAGLVVWMNASANDPGETPGGAAIDKQTGAISVGDGENTLGTFIDFMCPICNVFEQTYGDEILDLVDDGTITLQIHPIAILDSRSQGTAFSTRAANAMYCVAEANPDAAVAFMQAMFENQPEEGTPGLSDAQIIDIASGVGASDAADCISAGTYTQFVGAMTEKTPVQPGAQGVGTPTVTVNGEVIANSTLPAPGSFATLFR